MEKLFVTTFGREIEITKYGVPVEKETGEEITCPICGGELGYHYHKLFCRNEKCTNWFKTTNEHFVKD